MSLLIKAAGLRRGYPVPVVGRYSGNDTTYQDVASWSVTAGKRGILKEISVVSDNFDKTMFKLSVAGGDIWTDKQAQSALSIPFSGNLANLNGGEIVVLQAKSTDGTAITVDGLIVGEET